MTSGSAALSIPRPKETVSVWDARDHAVLLTDMALESPLRLLLDPDATLEDTEDKADRRKLAISIFLKGVEAQPRT